jgi:hypothetical protein
MFRNDPGLRTLPEGNKRAQVVVYLLKKGGATGLLWSQEPSPHSRKGSSPERAETPGRRVAAIEKREARGAPASRARSAPPRGFAPEATSLNERNYK